MSTAALLGTGIGLGLWAVVVWLLPPRTSLASAFNAIRSAPVTKATAGAQTRCERWALPAVRPLAALGLPTTRQRRDLLVLERSTDSLLAEQAIQALIGLLLPSFVQALVWSAGMMPPWQLPFLAGIGCAAGGFLLSDLKLRNEAERRRSSFVHAMSAYLNLARVSLAGGAGVEGALTDAVHIGQGWAFGQIRHALNTARLGHITPWGALRQLGEELQIREVIELSSSVSLAGTEGAKVRASLAAKATAMRSRELADAEGNAQAATERMSLPLVCLFAGFLIFIAYPAMVTVLGNL